MEKRRHHFVWQHYLEPWTTNGQIACLRNGVVFTTSTQNIGVKKDFYRLREMSDPEYNFMKDMIASMPKELQQINMRWLNLFHMPKLVRQLYDNSNLQNVEVERHLQKFYANAEEDLHQSIEAEGSKYLDMLRNGDAEFFDYPGDFMNFIYFVVVQSLRTRKRVEALASTLGSRVKNVNIENIMGPMRHVLATSTAANIIMRRDSYWLTHLSTPGDIEFITSDQPVLNTYAVYLPLDTPPKRLELFYPISPEYAILIGDYEDRDKPDDGMLPSEDVRYYNRLMFDEAHEQVYASSEQILHELRAR